MQKNYWWRIGVLMLDIIIIGIAYIIGNQLLFGFCDEIYYFGGRRGCLDTSAKIIGEPLFIIALSLLVTSPFLFFINDNVFLKWFRFALVWFSLAAIFIFFAPVYSGNIVGNPTKESISIWMGSLFVILSLGQFVWYWNKSKK